MSVGVFKFKFKNRPVGAFFQRHFPNLTNEFHTFCSHCICTHINRKSKMMEKFDNLIYLPETVCSLMKWTSNSDKFGVLFFKHVVPCCLANLHNLIRFINITFFCLCDILCEVSVNKCSTSSTWNFAIIILGFIYL